MLNSMAFNFLSDFFSIYVSKNLLPVELRLVPSGQVNGNSPHCSGMVGDVRFWLCFHRTLLEGSVFFSVNYC